MYVFFLEKQKGATPYISLYKPCEIKWTLELFGTFGNFSRDVFLMQSLILTCKLTEVNSILAVT